MLSQILTEDCYMLDLESTGLSPITNAITSVCLVRFNLNAGNIQDTILDYKHFRITSKVASDLMRVNNAETMQFRYDADIDSHEASLPPVNSLDEITSDISQYISDTKFEGRNLFALHTEFDVAFLKGYYEATPCNFPFKHRKIFELTSLIAGMDIDFKEIRDEVNDLKITETIGALRKYNNFVPHNALYDCVRQICFLHRAAWKAGIIS